jgi:hypothetical protein
VRCRGADVVVVVLRGPDLCGDDPAAVNTLEVADGIAVMRLDVRVLGVVDAEVPGPVGAVAVLLGCACS